ncbi:AAA family ATPase [Streptomyces collinus]|uniref:Nuclease SbcCD subunit C n=1 Tax=Streptomyces collinus TaxID=42684 RepID=A0AA89TLV2_STRCU|nr:SMC family ATPase [Streptomyces collinus]MBB5816926.1 exonuclease SbcC [Streptomyces collinus]WMX61848.1 SMC family ATPase [Streptomyces collinus]
MKIVRLTFSGVRSYPGTCEIDFTGKTLVGILGDTGAGKTSILEAIAVALYGRCSFTDQTAQLRSDDCQAMSVDLVFRVDGREWRAHRVFHATRGTQARLTDPDGKHTDGARAVDAAVRELLGIDYITFKSSVLVPQGRFGDLLNARDAERARILKSLFGVDELQRVRQLADGAVSRIKDLISQARQEDARLLADPGAQAQADRQRHERAFLGASDLDDRLAELRRLQTEAAQTSQHARLSVKAAAELAERCVADYGRITASVRQAQEELQQLQEANAAAETAVQNGLTAVTAEQERAVAAGLAPDVLAAAAQVLGDMPGRLSTLAQGQAEHAQFLDELASEEEALARRADELKNAETHVAELGAQAQDTDEDATAANEVLQALTTAVRHAGEAAGVLALQRANRATSSKRLSTLLQDPPGSDPDKARAAVVAAQDVLDGIRRQEAAHTAGDGLVPGDGCSVCARPLPDDYQPPQPQDDKALAQAAAAVESTSAALSSAEQEHARHTHEVEGLQRTLQEHEQQVKEAAAQLEASLPAVREQAMELASRTDHPQPAAFAKELETAVATSLARLTDGAQPTAVERETLTGVLLQVARGRVVQLQEAADAGRSALAQAEAQLGADRTVLEKATQDSGKAREQAGKRSEHLKNEQRSLLASLSAMPEPVRTALPPPPQLPTADHLAAAAEAVRHEQSRQQELAGQQAQLQTRAQELLVEQSELAGRQQREVTDPLHQLEVRLQRWADSASSAAALVEESARPALPPPGVASNPAATEEYAAALKTAGTLLLTALDGHDTAARAAMAELTTRLSAHAQEVAVAYPSTTMLQMSGETDPLDPTLLDGLSSHAGTLRNEAERALSNAEKAESQIPHKEQLADALAAGERQLAAWQAVSTHMTDGKFLGHLTDLRTRALLAHGSELLQQLSGGRLGFADDFDIVSLTSHTRRSSRTLSGGETFQASLALSLALMEMHGRSGTRMESLFLDEGFGTLDSASLDSALQVLRTHVGTDTLLAVISHLRPVAETVHDVLWVEKDHRGSQARWLSAPERDSLVRDDLHNLAELA